MSGVDRVSEGGDNYECTEGGAEDVPRTTHDAQLEHQQPISEQGSHATKESATRNDCDGQEAEVDEDDDDEETDDEEENMDYTESDIDQVMEATDSDKEAPEETPCDDKVVGVTDVATKSNKENTSPDPKGTSSDDKHLQSKEKLASKESLSSEPMKPQKASEAEQQEVLEDEPIRLCPMQSEDEEVTRWLIYKRIFVTDVYNLAMDNLFSSNCGCLMVALLCMLYNLVGLVKALLIVLLGVPLAMVAVCRTLVLWRLILRSGPDIRLGVHDYWIKAQKNRSIFTAKYQSKVVGTVALVAITPTIAEISRVATDRECVRKGVGACLMQYILSVCERNGFEEVVLTVGESNYPACVLFEKFGFRVTREVQDSFLRLLKWKGYLMRLTLRSPEDRDIREQQEVVQSPECLD